VAVAVALARGEDSAAAVAERVVQREVLAFLGRLGELDVVDDRARTGGVELADNPRVV
jgi:hypothetical protein